MINSLLDIKNIRSEGIDSILKADSIVRNRIPNIINYLGPSWSCLGWGRHRRVLKRGNVVIKIPMNLDGVAANLMERKIFLERRYDGIFAPCRMIGDGCLMMRAVDDIYSKEHLHPDWVNNLVDGAQVGIDRNGRVMVYDYSEEFDRYCLVS